MTRPSTKEKPIGPRLTFTVRLRHSSAPAAALVAALAAARAGSPAFAACAFAAGVLAFRATCVGAPASSPPIPSAPSPQPALSTAPSPSLSTVGAAISARYNVRDFGAVGGGAIKETSAIQKALDTCAVSGGGEVIVPAGVYLIGSLQLGNRTILHLEEGSVLRGSPDLADYPMLDVRWEGRWQPGHRALIYATNVDHTGIIGPGRIEGAKTAAAPQNPRGAVVLEPVSCSDVRWEGFTVVQGGNWATHPTYCTDVSIRNVTIHSDRDGIDIDSCSNVRIEGCQIDSGDDSISLKSGRGMDGARIARPTENVRISGCTLVGRRFACLGIGSETSGGIRDVRIEHCSLTSRTFGIYIKTRIGRGGAIEDITGDDLDVPGGGFLRINLVSSGNNNTADDPVDGLVGYPLGRNYRFSHVRLNHVGVLAEATQISADKPLQGLTLTDVTGTCSRGISIANATGVELRGIQVSGYEGPLLRTANVTGRGLEGAVAIDPAPPKAR